jgi:hypothetical protein
MADPLLNPQQEAAACRSMIRQVESMISASKSALTTSVLDRETYLVKIGGVMELERALSLMQREYDRNFKV